MKKNIKILVYISIVSLSASALLASSYNNYSGTNWSYSWPSNYSNYSNYKYPSYTPRYSSNACYNPRSEVNKPAEQQLEAQYDNLIIMFTKNTCPYCQYMHPIIKRAQEKYPNINFLFVDIDENPNYPNIYGFSTVPQIYYFKKGKKLDAHGSADKTMTQEQVEEKIENYFPDVAK